VGGVKRKPRASAPEPGKVGGAEVFGTLLAMDEAALNGAARRPATG
jgi:hypothetical protein